MRKFSGLVGALFTIAFAAIVALAAAPSFAETPIERALESVVALDIRVPGGGQSCSGWVYTPRRILTAAHCTDKAVFFIVRFHDGTATRARLVGQSLNDDVAVLELVDRVAKPLSIGKPANLGQDVYAIGHPGRYEWTTTGGIISAFLPVGTYYGGNPGYGSTSPLLQHDAMIFRGSSGGPLINSLGQVVGVNVGGDGRVTFVGFAVSAAHAVKIAAALEAS